MAGQGRMQGMLLAQQRKMQEEQLAYDRQRDAQLLARTLENDAYGRSQDVLQRQDRIAQDGRVDARLRQQGELGVLDDLMRDAVNPGPVVDAKARVLRGARLGQRDQAGMNLGSWQLQREQVSPGRVATQAGSRFKTEQEAAALKADEDRKLKADLAAKKARADAMRDQARIDARSADVLTRERGRLTLGYLNADGDENRIEDFLESRGLGMRGAVPPAPPAAPPEILNRGLDPSKLFQGQGAAGTPPARNASGLFPRGTKAQQDAATQARRTDIAAQRADTADGLATARKDLYKATSILYGQRGVEIANRIERGNRMVGIAQQRANDYGRSVDQGGAMSKNFPPAVFRAKSIELENHKRMINDRMKGIATGVITGDQLKAVNEQLFGPGGEYARLEKMQKEFQAMADQIPMPGQAGVVRRPGAAAPAKKKLTATEIEALVDQVRKARPTVPIEKIRKDVLETVRARGQ